MGQFALEQQCTFVDELDKFLFGDVLPKIRGLAKKRAEVEGIQNWRHPAPAPCGVTVTPNKGPSSSPLCGVVGPLPAAVGAVRSELRGENQRKNSSPLRSELRGPRGGRGRNDDANTAPSTAPVTPDTTRTKNHGPPTTPETTLRGESSRAVATRESLSSSRVNGNNVVNPVADLMAKLCKERELQKLPHSDDPKRVMWLDLEDVLEEDIFCVQLVTKGRTVRASFSVCNWSRRGGRY